MQSIHPARGRLPAWAVVCILMAVVAPAAGVCGEQQFPDVVDVRIAPAGGERFSFQVTISSPYDTPTRYADGFHIRGLDGAVYGERRLLHDHAGEQPFTRALDDVSIPAGVRSVVVQARDQKYGYGGDSMTVDLPGR